MEKRYQVFISSTFVDLQDERREVIQALLELDCIPAGMELFQASNDDQWTLIKKVIDQCDYYILITAGRYGSRAADGISYTEKEFDYAIESGKQVLSFVHKDLKILPAGSVDVDQTDRDSLDAFHAKAKTKMCKFWSTPIELGSHVKGSIVKAMKDFPSIGWIRADLLPTEFENKMLMKWSEEKSLQSSTGLSQTQFSEHLKDLALRKNKSLLTTSSSSSLLVAYLGPIDTYSHAASLRYFGDTADYLPQRSLPEVFKSVDAQKAHYGVVSIESSSEGMMRQALDLLVNTNLRICGEINLHVECNLLSKESNLEKIQIVLAHSQSLSQCRNWLSTNLSHAQLVAETSTASAARHAADAVTQGVAAIAGSAAAQTYSLKTIATAIEGERTNKTRFMVVGDHYPKPTGQDATTLFFTAPHRPNGLMHVLKPIGAAGVNMTRIESMPSQFSPWDYVFFVDVDGHEQDKTLSNVIAEIRGLTTQMRVLGSYPKSS